MKNLILALSLVSTSSFAGYDLPPVSEAPSSQCNSSSARAAYDRAYEDTFNELEDSWLYDYYEDCDRQVEFEVINDIELGTEGGSSRRNCQNKGRNDATADVLADISSQCRYSGSKDGRKDGKKYGEIFCKKLAYKSSLGDYDLAYQKSCKAALIGYVQYNCGEEVEDQDKEIALFKFAKRVCNLD